MPSLPFLLFLLTTTTRSNSQSLYPTNFKFHAPNSSRAPSYPSNQLPHLVQESTYTQRTSTLNQHLIFSPTSASTPQSINMSTVVEKVTDAVKDVTASLGNTSISDKAADTTSGGEKAGSAAHNDAVLASAAEGRRLYIGNLAYATTEGELTNFFKGYLV